MAVVRGHSNPDLFMCADRIDARIQRKLRIMVTPDNLSLPEVELNKLDF